MVQTGISDVSAEIIEWVHEQPYWVQLAVVLPSAHEVAICSGKLFIRKTVSCSMTESICN